MSTLYVNTITPNSGDTVAVSGSLTVSGKFTIGDETTDTVAITAEVSSSIVPDADSSYNLGSNSKRWADGYIDNLSFWNFSTKYNKRVRFCYSKRVTTIYYR